MERDSLRDRPTLTPAMIAAGEAVVRDYSGIADPSDLSARVYIAMRMAQSGLALQVRG